MHLELKVAHYQIITPVAVGAAHLRQSRIMLRKPRFLAAAAGLMILSSVQVLAQAPPPSAELEAYLYIQNSHGPLKDAIYVMWIPQPVLKYCVDRPTQDCLDIDGCIRTTSRQVKMCQNLPIDISRIPRYPPETQPRRILGVTYYRMVSMKGWDTVLTYFHSKPPSTFDRLTPATRIKARIRFTRKPDDDSFDVLEVLALPPA